MKHKQAILSCATIMLSASVWAQTQGQRQVTFDTTTPFVHDPVMAYENGVYHIYSTGNNIGHMTSTNRHTWHVERDGVIQDIPAWTHDSVPGFRRHIWAPDIIRWRGRWWLAYSCSTFGKNTSAIGLLSNKTLNDDNWKDNGCLLASQERRDNWNAIDPAFAIDSKDSLWLAWGSFWDGIQLAPLEMRNGKPQLAGHPRTIARRYKKDTTDQPVNSTSRYAGTNAIEAPFIMHHDGLYYLFVSCRGAQSTYRVVVGRSKDIIGPYIDKEGVPMYAGGGTPVITGDGKLFEAAGHCAAYHLPDKDLFICHGYSIPQQGQSILIQRDITWKDGWPRLNDSVSKHKK